MSKKKLRSSDFANGVLNSYRFLIYSKGNRVDKHTPKNYNVFYHKAEDSMEEKL